MVRPGQGNPGGGYGGGAPRKSSSGGGGGSSGGGGGGGSSGGWSGTPGTPNYNPGSGAKNPSLQEIRDKAAGGGGGSAQSWDINQAVNNRVAFLKQKYGVSDSDLNRANIQAELESAHARGVYSSSSQVESSGSISRQEVSTMREFQAQAARLNEIKTGGREASAQELREFRGSLDPQYVAKRERELEVQNYASQYPGSYKLTEVNMGLGQHDRRTLERSGVPQSYIEELDRRRLGAEDYSRLKKYGLKDWDIRRIESRKSVYVKEATGQGFTYKGETYYSRAAGEKIVELKEAGLLGDVTRRRELTKDFERYGGTGSKGEPLMGGIFYEGKTIFGAQAADVVADLEAQGKVKVKNYMGGMEIDEGKPDTLPMIFGAASLETRQRVAEYERSQREAAYEQSRLLGLDVNPFKERVVDMSGATPSVVVGQMKAPKVPEGIAVEGFDVKGSFLPDKYQRAGLEYKEKSGPYTTPQYTLEPVGWPSNIRDLGFNPDAPLIGGVMERYYSERRELEKEARLGLAMSSMDASNSERQIWAARGIPVLRNQEEATRWVKEQEKARGLEVPSVVDVAEYAAAGLYRISPPGIAETVMDSASGGRAMKSPLYTWSGSKLSEVGSIDSEEPSRYWYNRPEAPSGKTFTALLRAGGMEATKAESWGKRLESVDLPYIDIKTTFKGDVTNVAALVGAAEVTAVVGAASATHAAVRAGSFLAGAAVMPPVTKAVTSWTGDKFIGTVAGIGASILVANPEYAGRMVNRFVTGPIERAVSPKYVPADKIGERLAKAGGYEGINANIELKSVHTDPISKAQLIRKFGEKEAVTVHVSSSPEWNIAEGQRMLLKGYPDMAKGFRQRYDLLDYYRSLPTDAGNPQAYLAYLPDITPADYAHSELLNRFELFGSKNRLLIERTQVRYFKPEVGESLMQFSERTGQYSGQTFIAPENLYGLSVERQAVTPAAYRGVRGIEYPGTVLEKTRELGFTYYWDKPAVPEWVAKIPGGSKMWETAFTKPVKLHLTETKTVVPLAERAGPSQRMGAPAWRYERAQNIREVNLEDLSPSVRVISGSQAVGSSSSSGGLLAMAASGSWSRSRSNSPSVSRSASPSPSPSPSPSRSLSPSPSRSMSPSMSPSRSMSPSASSSRSMSPSSSPSRSGSPSVSESPSLSPSPSISLSSSPQYSASRMSRTPRPPDLLPMDVPTPRRRRVEKKGPRRGWVQEEIPLPGMEAENILGFGGSNKKSSKRKEPRLF